MQIVLIGETSCTAYGVLGLGFTAPRVKPVCATSMPTAIAAALSAMQGAITGQKGTYSSSDGCSLGTAVRRIALSSGTLTMNVESAHYLSLRRLGFLKVICQKRDIIFEVRRFRGMLKRASSARISI
jgi:hypothetical protein